MSAKQLGFGSSFKMLTRDKGWLKPVMVLTLVGWIPIVGQIAILGYAYEWARLTAWGVDAAPKQRGVDYGKVMTTGARAFGVIILMNIVISLLSVLVPVLGVSTVGILSLVSPLGALSLLTSGALLGAVAWLVVSTLASTFVSVCALRAAIYDRFSAGWRVDRVFQMVVRDFGGFMHTFLISLLVNLLPFAFALVALIIGGFFVSVGVIGFDHMGSGYAVWTSFPLSLVMSLSLIAVVLVVLALFVFECLGVIAQLVSVNAVGQWVQRFDVSRWGTSADPLPTDVPHRNGSGPSGSAPLPPADSNADGAPDASASAEPPVAPAADAGIDGAVGSAATASAAAPAVSAGAVGGDASVSGSASAGVPAASADAAVANDAVNGSNAPAVSAFNANVGDMPPVQPAAHEGENNDAAGEQSGAQATGAAPVSPAADAASWFAPMPASDAAETAPLPPVPDADAAAAKASVPADAAPTTVLPAASDDYVIDIETPADDEPLATGAGESSAPGASDELHAAEKDQRDKDQTAQ